MSTRRQSWITKMAKAVSDKVTKRPHQVCTSTVSDAMYKAWARGFNEGAEFMKSREEGR